jgi:hypothetical protein
MHVITSSNPPHGETDSAGAPGSPSSTITGAVPAPAAPDLSVDLSVEAKRKARADDLAASIGTLRVTSEEIRALLVESFASAQEDGDWGNLEQANAHLIRLASDLHSHLMAFAQQIGIAHLSNLRRSKNEKRTR